MVRVLNSVSLIQTSETDSTETDLIIIDRKNHDAANQLLFHLAVSGLNPILYILYGSQDEITWVALSAPVEILGGASAYVQITDPWLYAKITHQKENNSVSELLALDAVVDQKDVTVSDGITFEEGQYVFISDDNNSELNIIDSILGDVLTMLNPLLETYEVTANALVLQENRGTTSCVVTGKQLVEVWGD